MTATFQPGCLFDSALGHYVHPEVIKLARREGMNFDPFEEFTLNRYDALWDAPDYPDLVSQGGLLDKAVEWLNDNRAPHGYLFDFNEGDFGLYRDNHDED